MNAAIRNQDVGRIKARVRSTRAGSAFREADPAAHFMRRLDPPYVQTPEGDAA